MSGVELLKESPDISIFAIAARVNKLVILRYTRVLMYLCMKIGDNADVSLGFRKSVNEQTISLVKQ